MASITLRQKKGILGGTNLYWGTITGSTTIGDNYNCHCIYSADVSLNSGETITSVTFKNTLAADMSASLTFRVYLYTSDPTSNSPSSPPSGYVASTSASKYITLDGITSSVTFMNLSLTGVTKLYFWVTATYNAANGAIYCCDEPGVSQPTAVSLTATQASMTLAVSPSSVTTSATGSKVNLTIGNGGAFTLYADFYYGSSQNPFKSVRVYNGNNQVSCTKQWFTDAGVSMLTTMTITVKIRGGNNTPQGSFTLNAGSDMSPTVGTPTVAIVQGASAATDYPNTYIAGISKAKVSVVASSSTNAAISSVVLSYPGGTSVNMSYNSSTGKYEATTAAPITQNTTFTVTVRDQRNLTSQATVSITGVVAYTQPSVVINVAYRCNSSGVETSGGEYFKIRVTASYNTSLSGNVLKKLTAGIKNGATNDLVSGTLCGPFSGTTNPKSAYVIVVVVQDKVSGEIAKEITLEGLSRNVVTTRSDDGTYLGVGTTPSRTSGKSAVELPDGGSFLIGGEEYGAFGALVYGSEISQYFDGSNASFGNDFLNVDMEDRYAPKNAAACFSSWGGACANGPNMLSSYIAAGLRLVYILTGMSAVVVLIEVTPSPGRVWINVYQEAWKGWKYFYTIGDTQ